MRQKDSFVNVVYKMPAILSQPHFTPPNYGLSYLQYNNTRVGDTWQRKKISHCLNWFRENCFRHLSFIMFTENKPDYVKLKAQLHMQQDHSDKHN